MSTLDKEREERYTWKPGDLTMVEEGDGEEIDLIALWGGEEAAVDIPNDLAVRYIKLGPKGIWVDECLEKKMIRYSFGTGSADRFSLCMNGQWEELRQLFLKEHNEGKATDIVNQTRRFFEDDGSTLWIMFHQQKLFWGRLSKAKPRRYGDDHSVFRVVEGGWHSSDTKGDELTLARLAGSLTKVAGYQGTSCGLSPDVATYLIQRINGQKSPKVERAVKACSELKDSVIDLLKLLGPKDFELLVDLVFASSGWRRQGQIGKTQKFIDIELLLPSTGELTCVQVKSHTTASDLADYVQQFREHDIYKRMFYVYHSGSADIDDDAVTVLGPEKFAELVMDAGLANWLIQKVS